MSDSDSINDELSSGFSEENNPVFFQVLFQVNLIK